MQNFFSSSRAVVLRRFFVLVYRETPGERLSVLLRHSVHSNVTTMRTPLALAIILQPDKSEPNLTQTFIFSHYYALVQVSASF